MKSLSINKGQPNWLFRGLVGISLGIHLVVFMHVSGIYRSNALSYIELTMHDMSKPLARSIPRPRHRPKMPEHPQDIKRLKITQRSMPHFKPLEVEPAEKNLPDSLVEGIAMPEILDTGGFNIANWNPDALAATSGHFATPNSYLEMVRLKIERYKEYPNMAKVGHVEGRVTVRFIIARDGSVREAEVVKTSAHRILDVAALKAVQDAAPFPRPPRRVFKGEIPLELTIFFELT